MNTIQKFFYRFTREYKTKKANDWNLLKDYLEKKGREMNSEEREREEEHNRECPSCGSNTIVNKIQRVHGETRGSFHWGSGSVYGSVDTEGVNHCNSCGNQWKKYNRSYIDTEEVIREINRTIKYFQQGWEYDRGIKEELNLFYAETLYDLFISNLSHTTIPSKSWLRENFRSIYER